MAIDAGYTITPLSGSGIQIQYSADSSTWHATFTDGDVYMRQKIDGGDWTDPIKIVGEDGKNAVVMTSATTPSGEYEGQVGIWQNQIYFWTNGAWVNQTPELPTDAVLHYSFDDVPDYPDGTAVFFADRFTTLAGWTAANNVITSIVNQTLQLTCVNRTSLMVTHSSFTGANLSNKIVKIKIKANFVIQRVGFQLQSGTYPIYFLTKLADDTYMGLLPNNLNAVLYLYILKSDTITEDEYTQIQVLYIGNGSYSTPIIDNANGQNNATNNGGIAVQGVSGKGLYFLESAKKTVTTKTDNILNGNKWTVSLWINLNEGAEATGKNPRIYNFGNIEYAFISNLYKGFTGGNRYIRFYTYQSDGHWVRIDLPIETLIGQIIFIAISTELNVNGISTKTVYLNGQRISSATSDTITERPTKYITGYIGSADTMSATFLENTIIDDFQIFDRALSDKEVLALYQNKANTPKYFTLSDFSLEQIDDDNVVDHLTEKPQLLSKWLEIYNTKNVSSALPTSNVSTNGEYKGVINTANEVGVISTEQLENYIQATNALRSALWGTNGYLVDMNTDSTLNGNLDTLFANYRETLQIARTQITQQQASIASALSVVNSNPFQLIPVDSQGVVITGGYDNTGTRLQVFNGTTVLTPKSSSATLSNGEWKVVASGSGIVAGSQTVGTGDNKYIDFGNVSNLTDETAVITYTINVMLNNTLNTIYVVQKFGKSKEGADGRIYTLLPDYTAVKKSADGSVLTPSSVTVQAKSWTGSSIPEPYSQGDLVALENGQQIASESLEHSITFNPTGNYPVVVNLYRHGTNTLIDTVTIPVLQEVKGDTPVIDATKTNGVTTITADGTAIATINDGAETEANLLHDSKLLGSVFGSTYPYYKSLDNGVHSPNAFNGFTQTFCDNSNNSSTKDFLRWENIKGFTLEDKFTLSFWAKGTGKIYTYWYGANGYVTVRRINSNSDNVAPSNYGDGSTTFTLTSEWKQFFVTYQLNSTGDNTISKYILFRAYAGAEVYIAGVKFEHGDNVTNWVPHVDEYTPSVVSTTVQYKETATNVQPTTGWGNMPATLTEGYYLWTKTTVTYSDNSEVISYTSNQNSADGTKMFTSDQTRSWTDSQWNDYSTVGRVTSWNNSTVEGMRVGDILQIPATLTGQGNITGVVYSRITSIPTTKSGGLYQIPTVTLYGQKGNKGDKGDTGVGITAVTEYYLRNNSSTAPAFDESTLSNWSTTALNPISTAQYLWNAERITKSDGTTTTYEYMTPHLAMKYTANGTDGKGIVSIKNYYLASSLDSGVTTDTQGWTEAVQTVSSTNRYLWNYEEITYTTGNPTKTSPAIIGTFGAVSQGNWTASHSYKVSDIVYYQGSSYICKTAHTSGSTFDSSKWNKLADKGGDGKGVVSVIAYTALSQNTTKPAESEFTTTAKFVDSTNRYLWRYEVTTYTDNTTTGSYADATVIGVWGNSGIDATSVSISSEQIEVMCGSGNGKFLGQQTQKITVYARKGSVKKACTLSFTSPVSGTGITITKQNGTALADGYFNITFADNGNLGGYSTNSFDLSLTVTVDTVPFVFTVKAVKASKGVYLGRCASKPSTATVTVYTGDTWNGSSVTKYALKGDYVSVVNMTESDSNRGKMFQWNGSQWNEDGNTGHAMEALDDMLLMADTLPDGSRATKFLDRLITNEVLAKRMTSLEVMFKEFVASFKGSNYEQGDLSISMGKNPKNLYDDNLNFNIQSFLAMLPKSSTSSENSEMWRKEFYTEYDDVYKKTDLVTKGDISLGGALKTFDTVYGGANVEEQPFIYPDSFTSNDTVVFSVRQDMLRMFRCSNGTIYVYIGVLPSVQDQLAFSLSYTWNGNINQIYDIYQTYTEGQGFTEYISTSEGVYRYKDTESERFSRVVDKVFIRMNPYKGKVICWDDANEESFLFDGTNLTQIDVIGDVFVEFTENLYVGYAKYSTNPIIEFYNCNEDGFNRVGYNNLQGKPIYNIDAYTHKRGNSAGSINKNNIYGLYAVNGKLYLSYDTTVTEGKACMILRSNDCGNTWDIISSVISTSSTSTNSSRFLFGYNKDGLIVLCGSGTYSYSTNNGEKFTIKTTALSSWKWTGRGIEDFGQNSRDILIPYWSSGLKFKKLINVNTAEIFKKNISNQKGNLIKFRNGDGFSIQWGQTNNLGNASPASVKTAIISLTTGSNRQFYNNNYSVFVTLEGSTSGLEIAVTNKSSTGFTITAYNRNSETTVNNVIFHWLAIGNTDK